MAGNPFVARGMIKSRSLFWGRSEHVSTIYSLLLDSEEDPQSIALVGLRKTGKSSLMYHIAHKRGAPPNCVDQLDRMVCVMLSLQEMTNAAAERFYEAILDVLRSYQGTIGEIARGISSASSSPDQAFNQVLRLMDKEGYLLVLLIDELESAAANPAFDKHFFDRLRSMAQQWRLAFVVAIQRDLEQLWDTSLLSSPHSSPFFNFFQTITLAGFEDKEADEYLRAVSARAGIPFGAGELDLIQDVGGVHPFFLNVAAYHVFKTLSHPKTLPDGRDALRRQITQDPAVRGNFAYYWDHLTSSQARVLKGLAEGQLEPTLLPETRVDLAWLERRGLVRVCASGSYKLFSNAFHEFVLGARLVDVAARVRETREQKTVQDLLTDKESDVLEFKSSLRWDYRQNKINKDVEAEIPQALAALLNTKGGTLIIGADDDGRYLGLAKDYPSLPKRNSDGFQLHLMDLISNRLGKAVCDCLRVSFPPLDEGELCRIDIDPSPTPVYVGSEGEFYIRIGNSTRKLNTREALDYISSHWPAKH